jgi:hypothetical protein
MRQTFLEGVLLQGRIQSTALQVPDELDDLQALTAQLQQEQRIYRNAPKHEIMAAIRRGEVRHTRLLGRQGGCNRIVRGFYVDFFSRLKGAQTAPGVNQTLFLEYFALGTNYAPTGFSDTQLGNEIFRAVPDELYEDGISTFYATTYLKKAQGNPTGNTIVSSSTSTSVIVEEPENFVANGRIQIETTHNTYICTIEEIEGNELKVVSITGGSLSNAGAFDSGDLPEEGNTVKALHSEAGCFIGGTATSSANTGTLMNRKRIEQFKDSSVSLLYDYILACTSVE